jgi:hypothetical protein
MENDQSKELNLRSFIWMPVIIMILFVIGIMLFSVYRQQTITAPLANFEEMSVSEGFHKISLPSGQRFDLSYEQNHDRNFDGIVRHISVIHEHSFPILSYDILVTTGDFADDSRVMTRVEDHHFTWSSRTGTAPRGTINLLHTVPMNQEIEEQLSEIEVGDHVVIQGWDILKIDGYTKDGEYIGYWQDAGCNTTLVTTVLINP